MTQSTPLISVIMPAYNRAALIGGAVDSVLAQTWPNVELIVVDDGSSDNTVQVLEQYTDRITLIRQENAGPSAARNKGLAAANGEYIAFLDSDDYWYPETLATLAAYLLDHPNVDMVCGGWDYIDEQGQVIQESVNPKVHETDIRVDFFGALVLGNLFPIHSLLLRQHCFDRAGFFDPELHAMEDWDLWLRMAAAGCRFRAIEPPLARYRRHGECITLEPKRMEASASAILEKIFSNDQVENRYGHLRPYSLAEIQLGMVDYFLLGNDPASARAYTRKATKTLSNARASKAMDNRFDLLIMLKHMRTAKCFLASGNIPASAMEFLRFLGRNPGLLVRRALRKIFRTRKKEPQGS